MFETMVWITGILCAGGMIRFYAKYRDPFHPGVLMLPMFAFIYVVMPLYQINAGDLFVYVSEERITWVATIVLIGLICLIAGLELGSNSEPPPPNPNLLGYRPEILHKGAYIIGGAGLLSWLYVIQNNGGFADVFSSPKGMGWSDIGFIREAAYLLIVGVLLLLSPQGYNPKSKLWRLAVCAFSLPYLCQGLLGAQRGPTFLVIVSLGMSWYMARNKRPSVPAMLASAAAVGMLLLFLVTNRDRIYVGSKAKMKTDFSANLASNEAIEYIFGAGCMVAASELDRFFWGKRYMAQVIVRPIPKQLWPTKYNDFGIPELQINAGVAGKGLARVMGWRSVPGAAAAMIADLYVEFSYLEFPVLIGIGYMFGMMWKRAVTIGDLWTTQYVIFALLSIFLVTQSGEAVIFRFVILTLPVRYVWKKAAIIGPAA